ncbi:protein TASOR 2 isoform X2 [Ranitomeya variabilis]|uniref:protein TASOR 2 isoform X2 n=1 Tax=Ranitomeya variabilis TaxID=490064 RepID=UPI004055AC25
MQLLEDSDMIQLNNEAHYNAWKGQLYIHEQLVCDISLQTPSSCSIPAQLPAKLDVREVIQLSELRKKLPEDIFQKTDFTGQEVFCENVYYSSYPVVSTNIVESELDKVLKYLKDQDLALIKVLNDQGFLILVNSDILPNHTGVFDGNSIQLNALFLFPHQKFLRKRDREEWEGKFIRKELPLSVSNLLPGLHYAIIESSKLQKDKALYPGPLVEQYFKKYAVLQRNKNSSSERKSEQCELLSALHSPADDLPQKCSQLAFSCLQLYISSPINFSVPVIKMNNILAENAFLSSNSDQFGKTAGSLIKQDNLSSPSKRAKTAESKADSDRRQAKRGVHENKEQSKKTTKRKSVKRREKQSKKKSVQRATLTTAETGAEVLSAAFIQVEKIQTTEKITPSKTNEKRILPARTRAIKRKPQKAFSPDQHLVMPDRRSKRKMSDPGNTIMAVEVINKSESLKKTSERKYERTGRTNKRLEEKMKAITVEQINTSGKSRESLKDAPKWPSPPPPPPQISEDNIMEKRISMYESHALNLLADLALNSFGSSNLPYIQSVNVASAPELQVEEPARRDDPVSTEEPPAKDSSPPALSATAYTEPENTMEGDKPKNGFHVSPRSIASQKRSESGEKQISQKAHIAAAKAKARYNATSKICLEHSYSQLPLGIIPGKSAKEQPIQGVPDSTTSADMVPESSANGLSEDVVFTGGSESPGTGSKHRGVSKLQENVVITFHWEPNYNFDLDSKFTSDPLEKTINRALHGPWNPHLKEKVEDVKIILHMWIALFYSKSRKQIHCSSRKVVEHSNPAKYVSINTVLDPFEFYEIMESDDASTINTNVILPMGNKSEALRIETPAKSGKTDSMSLQDETLPSIPTKDYNIKLPSEFFQMCKDSAFYSDSLQTSMTCQMAPTSKGAQISGSNVPTVCYIGDTHLFNNELTDKSKKYMDIGGFSTKKAKSKEHEHLRNFVGINEAEKLTGSQTNVETENEAREKPFLSLSIAQSRLFDDNADSSNVAATDEGIKESETSNHDMKQYLEESLSESSTKEDSSTREKAEEIHDEACLVNEPTSTTVRSFDLDETAIIYSLKNLDIKDSSESTMECEEHVDKDMLAESRNLLLISRTPCDMEKIQNSSCSVETVNEKVDLSGSAEMQIDDVSTKSESPACQNVVNECVHLETSRDMLEGETDVSDSNETTLHLNITSSFSDQLMKRYSEMDCVQQSVEKQQLDPTRDASSTVKPIRSAKDLTHSCRSSSSNKKAILSKLKRICLGSIAGHQVSFNFENVLSEGEKSTNDFTSEKNEVRDEAKSVLPLDENISTLKNLAVVVEEPTMENCNVEPEKPVMENSNVDVKEPSVENYNEAEKPAMENYSVDAEEPAVDNLIFEAEKPVVDNFSVEAEEHGVENCSAEAEEPAGENGSVEAEETVVENGSVETEEPAVENGSVEAEEPAVENGSLEAEEPAVENGSVEAEEPAVENGSLEAEEPAVENGSVVAEEPAVENGSVEAEESAVENGSLEAEEPAVENGSLEAEEPAVENGSLEAEEPAVENGSVVAEEPAVENDSVEAEESAVENGRFEAEEPAVENGSIEAEEPAVENSSIVAEEPAVENDSVEAEESAVENGSFEAEEPAVDNGSFEAEEPAVDNGGFEAEEPAVENGSVEAEESAMENGSVEVEEPAIENCNMETEDVEVSTMENCILEAEEIAVENSIVETEECRMQNCAIMAEESLKENFDVAEETIIENCDVISEEPVIDSSSPEELVNENLIEPEFLEEVMSPQDNCLISPSFEDVSDSIEQDPTPKVPDICFIVNTGSISKEQYDRWSVTSDDDIEYIRSYTEPLSHKKDFQEDIPEPSSLLQEEVQHLQELTPSNRTKTSFRKQSGSNRGLYESDENMSHHLKDQDYKTNHGSVTVTRNMKDPECATRSVRREISRSDLDHVFSDNRTLSDDLTQNTLNMENVRFTCNLKEILRKSSKDKYIYGPRFQTLFDSRRIPSCSHSRMKCKNPLLITVRCPYRRTDFRRHDGRHSNTYNSSYYEDELWDEPIYYSRTTRKVRTRRYSPFHFSRLRYETPSDKSNPDISVILNECVQSNHLNLSSVGLGNAAVDRTSASQLADEGGQYARISVPVSSKSQSVKNIISNLCTSLHSRLQNVARETEQKLSFYIYETDDGDFISSAKGLLVKDGHIPIDPWDFLNNEQSEYQQLLVIIKNEDIVSCINKIPCLMQLKLLHNVTFAGVDAPEDMAESAYEELFQAGGFVVSDKNVLESITMGKLKEVLCLLEKMSRTSPWKWLIHYRENRKLKEDKRTEVLSQAKMTLLKSYQQSNIIEILPYHQCDSRSKEPSDDLACLLNLQYQHIHSRLAVYLTGTNSTLTDVYEQNGVLVYDVDTFLRKIQKVDSQLQTLYRS